MNKEQQIVEWADEARKMLIGAQIFDLSVDPNDPNHVLALFYLEHQRLKAYDHHRQVLRELRS